MWLSGSLLLSLALSQSERARENHCGSQWLSVALCGSLSLAHSGALSSALWQDLSLSGSLSLVLSLSVSVSGSFLQLCKTTPIVAKR